MILLFEEQPYKRETLLDILSVDHSDFFSKGSDRSTVVPNCVGYYFSSKFHQPVFILPKVFNYQNAKGEQRAFGCVDLKEDQALDSNELKQILARNHSDEGQWNFELLKEMPSYLYQAIDRYRKTLQKDESKATKYERTFNIESSRNGENETTLIDQCHTLIRFYKNNQNLITLVYKQVHSGFNKVNWAKTVRTVQPIIAEDQIIYPTVFNHRKMINYDEELMILLFSTLRYINEEYGYGNKIDSFYSLPPKSVFAQQVKQRSVSKRLRKIKNNYSNDVMRKLWHLLYALHSEMDSFNGAVSDKEEYLFVKSFNNVFERMIDDLLGDSDYPKELKDQNDGKIIDHLLKYLSLPLDSKEVYYVGDSKYYKDGATPLNAARYKQFTYVKNIVQTQMNWYHEKCQKYLNYRDELTEGYSITPNFFIMGMVRPDYDWSSHHLKSVPFKNGKSLDSMYQFKNRLFDRDSLFLMQYSVNFLFILKAYTSFSLYKKSEFKETAKKTFRENFLAAINDCYTFYLLVPKGNNSTPQEIRDSRVSAVAASFRKLIGKIYCPTFLDSLEHPVEWLIMALEKNAIDNVQTLAEAKKYFDLLDRYKLGVNPFEFFDANRPAAPAPTVTEPEPEVEEPFMIASKGVPVIPKEAEIAEPAIVKIVDDEQKYTTHLPLYNIKAACGRFLEAEVEAKIEGWIDAAAVGVHKHGEEFFIVQASGESMIPKIQNGDYCLFRAGGSIHRGDIVIAGIHDLDEDYNGRFTIKEFWQEFSENEDGSRERTHVTLKPLNQNGEYPTFELDAIKGDGFGVFGVFVEIVKL